MDIRGRAVGTEQVAGAGPAENTGHADNAGLAEDARLAETAGRVAGVEAPLSTGHAQGSSGGSGRWPAFAIGRVRRATWVRVAVITPLFAFVLLAVPVILSLYFVDAMTQVVVYSIVALGLGVLVGRVGLYSLGQAAVLAIGAWTAARFLFATSLPYPVVLLAAGAITMVLGTVILLPALRLRGLYLALITLMLAGGDHYLYSIDFPTQESITLLAVVLMAGAYSLWGAIVAGLLLQLLPSLFQNWGVSSDWITILFGIGVLQVLTTAPRGLADQVPKDLRRLGRLLGGLARRATVSRARAS
jgi:ABC-type branched-subunit amino acid transport system permease subunit